MSWLLRINNVTVLWHVATKENIELNGMLLWHVGYRNILIRIMTFRFSCFLLSVLGHLQGGRETFTV